MDTSMVDHKAGDLCLVAGNLIDTTIQLLLYNGLPLSRTQEKYLARQSKKASTKQYQTAWRPAIMVSSSRLPNGQLEPRVCIMTSFMGNRSGAPHISPLLKFWTVALDQTPAYPPDVPPIQFRESNGYLNSYIIAFPQVPLRREIWPFTVYTSEGSGTASLAPGELTRLRTIIAQKHAEWKTRASEVMKRNRMWEATLTHYLRGRAGYRGEFRKSYQEFNEWYDSNFFGANMFAAGPSQDQKSVTYGAAASNFPPLTQDNTAPQPQEKPITSAKLINEPDAADDNMTTSSGRPGSTISYEKYLEEYLPVLGPASPFLGPRRSRSSSSRSVSIDSPSQAAPFPSMDSITSQWGTLWGSKPRSNDGPQALNPQDDSGERATPAATAEATIPTATPPSLPRVKILVPEGVSSPTKPLCDTTDISSNDVPILPRQEYRVPESLPFFTKPTLLSLHPKDTRSFNHNNPTTSLLSTESTSVKPAPLADPPAPISSSLSSRLKALPPVHLASPGPDSTSIPRNSSQWRRSISHPQASGNGAKNTTKRRPIYISSNGPPFLTKKLFVSLKFEKEPNRTVLGERQSGTQLPQKHHQCVDQPGNHG